MCKNLIFILCVTILWSCHTSEADLSTVIVDIDSDFIVSLGEHLDPDASELYLRFVSKDLVTCTEASLDYTLSRDQIGYLIAIRGISKPTDCDLGQSSLIVEDVILPNDRLGTFSVKVDFLKLFQNQGRLKIFEDRYELTLETQKGLLQSYKTLYRTPKNLIWGYISDINPSRGAQLADAFKMTLGDMIMDVQLPIGNFAEFTIQDDKTLHIRNQNESIHQIEYYFGLEGDMQAFKEKIKLFREQMPSGSQLIIYTGTGLTL